MQLAHALVLMLHSTLRWPVLGLALVVLWRSSAGWRNARPWQRTDDRWHSGFVHVLRVQVVLGLLLYLLLSPMSAAFWHNPSASMKVSELRFFGLEHPVMMLLAVGIADGIRGRSKKLHNDRQRQRRVCLSTLLVLALMLAAVPWPFMHAKRPWLRTSLKSQTVAAAQLETPRPPQDFQGCPPNYHQRCAVCHGTTGAGDGILADSLSPRPASFVDRRGRQRDERQLAGIIRDGGAAHGLSPLMPGHSDLSEDEVKALAGCVRSLMNHGR
jgi:hypothetical protein